MTRTPTGRAICGYPTVAGAARALGLKIKTVRECRGAKEVGMRARRLAPKR